MRLFLEALASMGDLHLLFYVTEKIAAAPDAAQRYVADFDRYWNLTVSVDLCPREPPVLEESILGRQLFRSPFGHGTGGDKQVAALAGLLATSPSLMVIHRLNAAYPLLRIPAPGIPILFDLDDVEHVAFFRSVLQPPVWRSKLLQYLRLPAIIRLERRVARLSAATFVCSDLDARYLSSVWRMPRVVAVPNAVTLPPQIQDAPTSNTILFVGRLSYAPNARSADYLVTEILPRIRARVPDARLLIVGARPESASSFGRHLPEVEFAGFAPDLADVYARASVVCCPIFSGSGTRVKIIEAAAFGKAIVSTTLGAEGLAFADNKEILLRDDPDAMAAACVSLLLDPRSARALGSAARSKTETLYDQSVVIEQIRTIVATAMAIRPRHAGRRVLVSNSALLSK